MILPRPADALHKAWLYRLVSAIADDAFLTSVLRFKGGTYAAMRGFIDRFSIDLDFDLSDASRVAEVRLHLENIFSKFDLRIDQKSRHAPQYFLKYENMPGERNTLELDVSFPAPKNNEYEPVRFIEIDRILYGHTVATMFSNKLVAILDRFEKHHSIAGRDIFDVHTFFLKGFLYKPEIIEERTEMDVRKFLKTLRNFIEQRVTQTILDEDLNTLLPPDRFRKIRFVLKQEVLLFLK